MGGGVPTTGGVGLAGGAAAGARGMRPRTIDVAKSMPVVKDLAGLIFDEELPSDELAQAKKKRMIDLPVPSVSLVADYAQFTPNTYTEPLAYKRRGLAPLPQENYDLGPPDYDMDWEDQQFLRNNSLFGGLAPDPSSRLASITFEKIIDILEHATGVPQQGAMQIKPPEALTLIQERLLRAPASVQARYPLPHLSPSQLQRMVEEMVAHWSQRRTKLRKALLPQYWPQTSSSDSHPHHTFRPTDAAGKEKMKLRRTRKNDSDGYTKLIALARDLHAARDLMDAVKQRELLKRDMVALSTELFEQALYDLTDTSGQPRLSKTLEMLRRRREQPALRPHKLKIKTNRAAIGHRGAGGGGDGSFMGGGGGGGGTAEVC